VTCRQGDPWQAVSELEGSQGDHAFSNAIYPAKAADIALTRLEKFEAEWGTCYPAIRQLWRRAWEHVVPFFAFAPGIIKMIYTTNCLEALRRRTSKARSSFRTTARVC
jgi:transposase-like protein